MRHFPLMVSVNLFSKRDLSSDLKKLSQDFSPPVSAELNSPGSADLNSPGLVRGRSGVGAIRKADWPVGDGGPDSDGPSTMSRQVTRTAEPLHAPGPAAPSCPRSAPTVRERRSGDSDGADSDGDAGPQDSQPGPPSESRPGQPSADAHVVPPNPN
jgi:hypothetical protein